MFVTHCITVTWDSVMVGSVPLQGQQVALPQTHRPGAVSDGTFVSGENHVSDLQLTILQRDKQQNSQNDLQQHGRLIALLIQRQLKKKHFRTSHQFYLHYCLVVNYNIFFLSVTNQYQLIIYLSGSNVNWGVRTFRIGQVYRLSCRPWHNCSGCNVILRGNNIYKR